MIDIAENKLPFSSCISGANDGFAFIEQFFDNGKLFDYSGIVLILFAVLYLTGNKLETFREIGRFSRRKPS